MGKHTSFLAPILIIVLLAGGMFYVFFWDAGSPLDKEPVETEGKDPFALPEIPIPDLDRQITIPASMQGEIAERIKNDLDTIINNLKEDPADIDDWLDLGVLRKNIEDLEGAREAWEYARAFRPSDPRAYNNLANLYIYYFHDNTKGEEYLLQGIEKSPQAPQLYAVAFEFYYDILGDEEKAKDILRKAISSGADIEGSFQTILDSLE